MFLPVYPAVSIFVKIADFKETMFKQQYEENEEKKKRKKGAVCSKTLFLYEK